MVFLNKANLVSCRSTNISIHAKSGGTTNFQYFLSGLYAVNLTLVYFSVMMLALSLKRMLHLTCITMMG